MRTLQLLAEVHLTEKQAEKILKEGKLVWDTNMPIATICDKPVKFVSARLLAKGD